MSALAFSPAGERLAALDGLSARLSIFSLATPWSQRLQRAPLLLQASKARPCAASAASSPWQQSAGSVPCCMAVPVVFAASNSRLLLPSVLHIDVVSACAFVSLATRRALQVVTRVAAQQAAAWQGATLAWQSESQVSLVHPAQGIVAVAV